MAADDQRIAKEANQLYWESDTSVALIAEMLSVSRRALYSMIEPQELTDKCASCGGVLTFSNRLRRAAGQAECSACGHHQTIAQQRQDVIEVPGNPVAGTQSEARDTIRRCQQRGCRGERVERAGLREICDLRRQ